MLLEYLSILGTQSSFKMADTVSVEVDVDTTFDTDVKEEEEEIDLKFSFEKRLENSVKVSCTLLDKLGKSTYLL